MRYGSKWPIYAKEWDSMVIHPDREKEFDGYAHFAIDHKAIYQKVQIRTGVQWYHIAVIHRREGNGNFNTYLGNGQSIHHVTTLVPKGRGPFADFTAGAVDALRYDALTSVLDWRLEKILYYCELFNGAGYDARGIPSPYIWGGTNIQVKGKYVADHEWNPFEVDTQPGCAPMLKRIADFDPSVRFIRETDDAVVA